MSLGVTVHWAEVYRRIFGKHFVSGGGDTQGTKQQEIAHSNCCYWRGACGAAYSVSEGVVKLGSLAKHFQNRV